MEKLEKVFLIGAMKSGTTSLYDLLIQHPEICPCTIKEPEYFSQSVGPRELKEKKYEDLFEPDFESHKYLLDASTGYTKHPRENGVPERIKAYGIDHPYLIYILRDPIDRIESHYNFMRIDSSWKKEIDDQALIDTSNYFLQLERYQAVFKPMNLLLLDFVELKKDPQKVCSKIFEFIGAPDLTIDLSDGVKNVTPPSNRKGRKIIDFAKSFSKMIPPSIQKLGRETVNKVFTPEKTTLSEEQKIKIRGKLAPDMHKLEENYGIDISRWGF